MRKVIIVLGIVLLLSAMAGAQEWHWNFDPYVSNPSGIQLGRGVYPFLIDIDDDDDLD
ncbi:MAG: hypothetical protein GY845_02640, partial [Planctomycetes bacterium]|nr:hypothetical protein [Planctomycetota bacterium]